MPQDYEQYLMVFAAEGQRFPSSITRVTKEALKKKGELPFLGMGANAIRYPDSQFGWRHEEKEYRDETYRKFWLEQGEGFDYGVWQPDERTFVQLPEEFIEDSINKKTQHRNLLRSSEWKRVEKSLVAVAVEGKMLQKMFEDMGMGGGANPVVTMLTPIADSVEVAYFKGDIAKKKIVLNGRLQCKDVDGAKTTEKGLEAVIQFAKGMIRLSQNNAPPEMLPMFKMGNKLCDNVKVKRSGKRIEIETELALKEFDTDAFKGASEAAKLAAQRTQSANNGRQCALAFHNYVDAMGKFPKAVLKGPKGHKYSWRVEILPYIEQKDLYDQYNFEEPWDSENNLEVMKKMPAVFRHPTQAEDDYSTSYAAVIGPDTLFWGNDDKTFSDVKDGTSNTIMFVEAKTDIPWTKPDDLEYDPEEGTPKTGGFSKEGFNAVFADGSVRFISKDVDEETMHRMLQISDGKVIENK